MSKTLPKEQLFDLIKSLTDEFLLNIIKNNTEALLSLNTELSKVICRRTNCVNIVEHNGKYICNLKYITMNELGKCINNGQKES